MLRELRCTAGTKITVHAMEHNKTIIGAEVQIFGDLMRRIEIEASKKDFVVLKYIQGVPEPKVCSKTNFFRTFLCLLNR